MKVITIYNNKGGVGKTTSVQCIGVALALFADQRVLLIDGDQQGNLTLACGIKLRDQQAHLANFILQEASLEETRIRYKETTIDILPASLELRKYEKRLEATKSFPFNIKQALEKLHNQYDYVVIDCPPAISAFSQMALAACHKYYIPLQAEYFSYEGLRNFAIYMDELKRVAPNIELGGIFATKFNPKVNNNLHKEIIQSVREHLGDKILRTYIRVSTDIPSSQSQGVHIFDYNKKSTAAQDYHTLTKEIWETLNRPE
jgi:chromosome partitioning protein